MLKSRYRWNACGIAGLLLAGLAALPLSAQQAATPVAAAPSTQDLAALANQGRFTDLLDALKASPEAPDNAAARSLLDDLERYRTNEIRREKLRRESYDSALDDVAKKVEANDLEEAMVSAIEAHSIADEPQLVLESPAVSDLVAKTEIAAKQAELDEDWVEAGVLYGRLNLLYEDDGKYREDVKRIGRHLRVLALYAPDAMRALQEARAKRLGNEDEFKNAQRDDETWENRLNGIDAEMLRESIKTASEQHIDHGGYPQLLRGSLEPLITLLDTPALADTFASLKDAEKVKTFRDELVRMKAELDNLDRPLTQFSAMSRIDEVLATNARTVDLPDSVIAYEMTEGALGTLDDFSSMYWPEDVDFLSRSTQGAFTGIGVQISRRDEQLTVVSPLNGTPAQAAGIMADDVIATVDGKDTSSWSLNKAVREITGPRGTEVTLGIRRVGDAEMLTYVIRRDRIEIESVKGWSHTESGAWDYWLDKDAGVGYVRLTQFIPQSVDKIDEAVEQLEKSGDLNALILDLRHNPGGLLTSAIQLVNRFLDAGPILFTVDGQRNIKSAWNAKKRGTYHDFDLVILVNQGSASASEIVSGALQDRGRAFIVGDRSYGKGSVQDVYWFPAPPPRAKYGLKVTTQYYQLPNGRIIHRTPESKVWGIDPDLAVDVTDQTVAWNLELRQEIDVLREKDVQSIAVEKSKPWVQLAGQQPVDPDADDAKETLDVPIPHAEDLLTLGLDPQLEAALLVLKTHQVADDVAVAQGR